jgi:tyrosinase
MRKISRRSFLAAGAAGAALDAIPFSTWIKDQAWAAGPRVRYNAYSPQGKAMLLKYRAGVQRMMNMSLYPEQNPLSWTFQWYTHWVKEPPGMASELTRIYPAPSPQKTLAQQMWETCQAHGGENEDFFLPWHRMYVYYFEMIVRLISYEPSFTLPYWNYSNPAQAAIPPEFADTTSPLYRANRNSGVNTGATIPPGLVALSALNEGVYSPNGADQGFCANLDFGLHGNVHVWVGNSQGMGSVPWAANDPIFWMHHSNIDRLWASWNRGNCKNPTYAAWLNQQFTFADIHGNPVVATVKDFNDISQLGYTYDAFEPATCLHIIKINPALLATLAAGLKLENAVQRVKLVPPPPPPPPPRRRAARRKGAPAAELEAAPAALPLVERVKALPPAARVYLVLKDVQADAAPGVHYDVYLDLPQGAQPNHELPNYVGTINFFGVTMTADKHAAMKPRTFSFDVTDNIQILAAKGELTPTPEVTIVPQGEANAGAKPTIGAVQLVSQ